MSERAGFVYVAFAIDAFSRAIVGGHSATIKDTDMVLTTLKMALWRRDQAGTPVLEHTLMSSIHGHYRSVEAASSHRMILRGARGGRSA